MTNQISNQKKIANILEEKLKELRFNYEDELQQLMEEIKNDTAASSRKEDEAKILELQSQLGL